MIDEETGLEDGQSIDAYFLATPNHPGRARLGDWVICPQSKTGFAICGGYTGDGKIIVVSQRVWDEYVKEHGRPVAKWVPYVGFDLVGEKE